MHGTTVSPPTHHKEAACTSHCEDTTIIIAADLMSVRSNGNSKGPGQPKVSQLHHRPTDVDEKVLRLKVAVDDTVLVAERCAIQKLVDQILSYKRQHTTVHRSQSMQGTR